MTGPIGLLLDRMSDGVVMRWRCRICGYIHVADMPPERCRYCGATSEEFVAVKADPEGVQQWNLDVRSNERPGR